MSEKKHYIVVEDAYQLRDNIVLGIYAAQKLQHLVYITQEDIVSVFQAIDGFQDIQDESSFYNEERKSALLQKIRRDMAEWTSDVLIEEFAAWDSVVSFVQSDQYNATQLKLVIIDGDLSERDYWNIWYKNGGSPEFQNNAKITSWSMLAKLLIDESNIPEEKIVWATNSLEHETAMSKAWVRAWLSDKYNFLEITQELHEILRKL